MTATSPRFLKAASNLIFMGYNARNDEILDNVTRMRREWEAQIGALATVRRFNATLSAKGYVWFWPNLICPSLAQRWSSRSLRAWVACRAGFDPAGLRWLSQSLDCALCRQLRFADRPAVRLWKLCAAVQSLAG
jgi:hypothetical protein